jgi:anti-sigma regulatory factor (Ser/Thr protein kinase)
MNYVETELPRSAVAAAEARGFLRAALQTASLDGWGEVTELLTTELVTNAVRHVGHPVRLRVATPGDRIRVEVDDDSSTEPRVVHVDEHETHGRGMLLVDHLSTRWGFEQRVRGKTVWFEISVVTATEEVHGT